MEAEIYGKTSKEKVVKCRFFDISSIISASRHRRSMKQLPFDSSQFDGSNGGIFRFLRPLDAEIFGETSKWRSTGSVKCRFFDISSFISASRHRRSMKQLPFDSSQFDGSNGSIFRFLQPLDTEIFGEMSKWRSTGSVKCRFVDILSIISASRYRTSMKQIPFDSSQCDGSNGSIF